MKNLIRSVIDINSSQNKILFTYKITYTFSLHTELLQKLKNKLKISKLNIDRNYKEYNCLY